ncbi:peptide methionine sulfoxide reductase A5 isoform X3 [Carya illinoinensis]|uniref:peptide methionine sulfoxide reductase A5 isoform X3 n=1 Tax=Carya illinoinensis TaxID=32201 RepID=UPI001C721401|nr:peptide methionine sulfoxide reductase A5 isoform X3 [Carya illinoinensis]
MAFLRSSSAHEILTLVLLAASLTDISQCIRIPDRTSEAARDPPNSQTLKSAVFALGSFWRSEAVFGCLNGVVRTTVGYAGGSKSNPEYRSFGDHAESVQVEYDPRLINFRQLLEVFWSSHDSRQVFGQGPDVGNQYSRSIIFTNGNEESRLAAISKEREQTKSKSSIVTTQIQQLRTFYPAEPEHQSSSKGAVHGTRVYSAKVGPKGPALVRFPEIKKKKKIPELLMSSLITVLKSIIRSNLIQYNG